MTHDWYTLVIDWFTFAHWSIFHISNSSQLMAFNDEWWFRRLAFLGRKLQTSGLSGCLPSVATAVPDCKLAFESWGHRHDAPWHSFFFFPLIILNLAHASVFFLVVWCFFWPFFVSEEILMSLTHQAFNLRWVKDKKRFWRQFPLITQSNGVKIAVDYGCQEGKKGSTNGRERGLNLRRRHRQAPPLGVILVIVSIFFSFKNNLPSPTMWRIWHGCKNRLYCSVEGRWCNWFLSSAAAVFSTVSQCVYMWETPCLINTCYSFLTHTHTRYRLIQHWVVKHETCRLPGCSPCKSIEPRLF